MSVEMVWEVGLHLLLFLRRRLYERLEKQEEILIECNSMARLSRHSDESRGSQCCDKA